MQKMVAALKKIITLEAFSSAAVDYEQVFL